MVTDPKQCAGWWHHSDGWKCRNCHELMDEQGLPVRVCSRAYELKRRRELGLAVDDSTGVP